MSALLENSGLTIVFLALASFFFSAIEKKENGFLKLLFGIGLVFSALLAFCGAGNSMDTLLILSNASHHGWLFIPIFIVGGIVVLLSGLMLGMLPFAIYSRRSVFKYMFEYVDRS